MRPISPRWIPALVVVAAVGLAGCDADTRDEIADAIGDAVSEAQSALDEVTDGPTDAATTAPTDAATEPSTEPPATEEPTTDPPAPAETEEPAPEPEPTPEETATATEEPTPEETTAAPEPSPSPTAEAVDVEDDSGIRWPLVLGLAAVLALLVWAFVAVWRRRQALLARRARLRDAALADLDWLMGAAREQVASIDAAARARDIRLRQDRLTENLQQLRAGASDELTTLTTAALTTSRQLTNALIARLDDAAAGRGDHGAGLGVRDLEQQLRGDRDDLAQALGARPDQR